MRYLPHTREDIDAMLEAAGAASLDDLYATIPQGCRMEGALDLPPALTEWELVSHMETLAAATSSACNSAIFLGAGCYDHYVPTVVQNLMSRSEFLTAYTPYQPEISQGTLQAIYEYQTLMCRIFGMEVANASMYDGASALAEALLMAMRITRRCRVAVSRAIHPHYRRVVETYLAPTGCEIVTIPLGANGISELDAMDLSDCAAVAVQSPNVFGCIEPLEEIAATAHAGGSLMVTTFTEPLAYGLLKNPGVQGADIVCGEGRSFGLGQHLGGMSLGVFAAKMKYVRNLPGRLVGRTVDRDGKPGFVLTLATREQHIRREKATSNICSNQSLCALGAAQYLACLGKTGIDQLARLNYNKAEYLKTKLREAGCAIRFSRPTFNEFVVEVPRNAASVHRELSGRGIVAGLPLGNWYPDLDGCFLVCATETKTKSDIDTFTGEVASCMNQSA